MKKLRKTEKQMPMETIGIDLDDKMSRYCMVNREGEVVEEGSFRNQVSSIEAHSSGSGAALRWKLARSRAGSNANWNGWA